MNEWKITTPQTSVTVQAHKASTTPAGALLLSNNSGELVRAFAPGAWLECEATKRGSAGYGA